MGGRRFPVSGLPQADWPAADRAALEAALKPAGRFAPGGLAAGWRPLTGKTTFQGYAYWLGWLRSRDELDPGVALADRVTLERVESELEGERATLTRRLGETMAPVDAVALHPNLAGLYRRKVEALERVLEGEDVAEAIRPGCRRAMGTAKSPPSHWLSGLIWLRGEDLNL